MELCFLDDRKKYSRINSGSIKGIFMVVMREVVGFEFEGFDCVGFEFASLELEL